MKAKIQGIEVEGTPEEITKFKLLLEQPLHSKSSPPIVNWYSGDKTNLMKWEAAVVDSGSTISINTNITKSPTIDKDRIAKDIADSFKKKQDALGW